MPTSPATSVRSQVKAILQATFPAATVRDGKLHPANGVGSFVIGIYPVSEQEGFRVLDQDTTLIVQVYFPWKKEVDPSYVADPTQLETAAEQLREAVYTATRNYAGTAGVWDFRVTRIDYTDDPTGQRTRFEATIQAIGQNFAETTA